MKSILHMYNEKKKCGPNNLEKYGPALRSLFKLYVSLNVNFVPIA